MPVHTGSAGQNGRTAVAGATGRVGRALLGLLADDPVEIVALTRNPHAGGLPEGVALGAIDFDRRETLTAALRGSERLFLAHGTSGQQVENEIALIDAAVAAGVRHIVKLSALGPPTPLNPYAWHMKIEAHLADQPVAKTVLRPSPFVEIFGRAGADIAGGGWAGAAGHGRTNFIDTRDVASVARVALLQEVQPGSDRAYHLTGARAWTMQEIAEELSRLLGRRVTYQTRSVEEQRAALLASGLPPLVANLLTGLDQLFSASALAETTTTVQELTGTGPRTVPAWFAENRDLFRPQR